MVYLFCLFIYGIKDLVEYVVLLLEELIVFVD